ATRQPAIRARSIALNSFLHRDHLVHAALVLALQWVLLFESAASVDDVTSGMLAMVALVLPLPGYLWAFNGTSLFAVIRTGHIVRRVVPGVVAFSLSYAGFVVGTGIIVKGFLGK